MGTCTSALCRRRHGNVIIAQASEVEDPDDVVDVPPTPEDVLLSARNLLLRHAYLHLQQIRRLDNAMYTEVFSTDLCFPNTEFFSSMLEMAVGLPPSRGRLLRGSLRVSTALTQHEWTQLFLAHTRALCGLVAEARTLDEMLPQLPEADWWVNRDDLCETAKQVGFPEKDKVV